MPLVKMIKGDNAGRQLVYSDDEAENLVSTGVAEYIGDYQTKVMQPAKQVRKKRKVDTPQEDGGDEAA